MIFSCLFVGDFFILGKLALCYMNCKWIQLLGAYTAFLNSFSQKGFMGTLLFESST